jgi:hypothetical protein
MPRLLLLLKTLLSRAFTSKQLFWPSKSPSCRSLTLQAAALTEVAIRDLLVTSLVNVSSFATALTIPEANIPIRQLPGSELKNAPTVIKMVILSGPASDQRKLTTTGLANELSSFRTREANVPI